MNEFNILNIKKKDIKLLMLIKKIVVLLVHGN